MTVPVTTPADLDRHLGELGLSQGQSIVVHSRLISFGRIEGGVGAVYDALRRSVGPHGTIAVPVYTFDLRSDDLYDPRRTPSTDAGVLSEYVRRLPGAVRSPCPVHSHAALGPAASLLQDGAGDVSFGPRSDFETMGRAGFSLLLLGCTFDEGATFVHHVEALVGVPYREWIWLPRRVLVAGAERPLSVRYYARASDAWAEDHDRVRPVLERAGVLRSAACPFGASYRVRLADLEEVVRAMLRNDPYAVVRRADGEHHG